MYDVYKSNLIDYKELCFVECGLNNRREFYEVI